MLSGFLHAQQDTIPPVKDSLAVNPVETGIASYYAKKFNGRKTTSGERFRNDSLTAAHKTLPLGTYVKVTNLKNDSVVIVKINDRLPKKSRRSIDLSQKAALRLNFMKAGLTKVSIEVLNSEFKK
ncbi:MAG: septal ring lytic transglycosylase RlpA family protein [Bacteroidetes bacterium]|nr:septal ring lytic transglycosylase RlpA family protein [Bacteroidota bacterium]